MTPLICPPKPSLEEFIKTCTPLARIDSFEAEIRERVDSIAEALLNYESTQEPIKNLSEFLKVDRDFLGIILALINLSQEKFLRILLAESFAKGDYESDWNIDKVHRKLRTEADFAERIAQLLLDGSNSPLLMQQVTSLYLEQLSLPAEWPEIIRDRSRIQKAILHKLAGETSNNKGRAIEATIRQALDSIEEKYGVTHRKGQVQLVGKEVDHAVPSTAEADAWVLIMTSYMETTSSSQTQRANEHRDMFLAIQNHNLRYGTKRIFVNFVDGAGWLARRSDLRKMHEGCDYIINLKTLDKLKAIICKYLPEKYFTTRPRPQVVEG